LLVESLREVSIIEEAEKRVRCPSPASFPAKHFSDNCTIESGPKRDSSYGSVTPLHGVKDTSQILTEHKEHAFPADLTALLRHQYGTDFAGLAAIWPKLPEHIRAAIMALAGTVKP
jgi:hypothetical protein